MPAIPITDYPVVFNTGRGEALRLTVRDPVSFVEVAELTIPGEHIARLIMGGEGRAFLTLRGLDRVGCKAEHKTLTIGIPPEVARLHGRDPEAVAARKALVAPYEVDGWHASMDDLWNHHRWVPGSHTADGGHAAFVTFHRHVRPDGTPVLPTETTP